MLAIGIMRRAPLYHIISLVLAGATMMGSWVLETGVKYVWDPAIRAYVTQPILLENSFLPYINMGIMALALIFFFYDLFDTVSEQGPSANPLQGKGGVK